MSKRLKFRVWYKDEKRYRPQNEEGGLFVLSGDGSLWFHYYDPSISSPEYGNIQRCCDSSFIIEQCTGVRDANRKLIYEGDILQKYKGDSIQLVVEWTSERALFELVSLHKITRTKIYWRITQDWISEFEVRVVGNIHENPELLKAMK